jgi:hypothetical protein
LPGGSRGLGDVYKRQVDTRAIFVTFAYSFANVFKESLLDNLFSND